MAITPRTRHRFWGRREAGLSPRSASKGLNMSSRSARRLSALIEREGHVQALSSPGRPPQATPQDIRIIVRTLKKDPWTTFSTLAQDLCLSRHRVAKIAAEARLFSYVARFNPELKPEHIASRLRWAQENKDRDWRRVLFTDESMMSTNNAGRVRVIRPRNAAYEPEFTLAAGGQARRSLMVWGAIGYDFKPPLVRFKLDKKPQGKKAQASALKRATNEGKTLHWTVDAQVYAEQILFEALGPLMASFSATRGDVHVVEDGASVHFNKECDPIRELLALPNIDHPARSPDLNPIEHMWALVKLRLRALRERPKTEEELWEAVQAAWDAIPMEVVNSLVMSMPCRREAVVCAKGLRTRY